MHVWGLTGNIACGKSAVEARLRELGVPVIDADVVARDVVKPGSDGLAAVVREFGDGVLDGDELDRKALGAVVFADADARKRLEAITHPRIFASMGTRLAALAAEGEPLAVVSAALMVESGSYRNYAGLAVVVCPPDVQLKRLMARDGSTEAEARARIGSQLPQREKRVHADVVLDNGGSRESLRVAVDAWIADLRPDA